MSPIRQPSSTATGLALDLTSQQSFASHFHDHHQLAMARQGVLVMSAGQRTWVLPSQRALWIPSGVAHSVAVSGPTTMLSVYIPPGRCPLDWSEPVAVEASGLLGPLVCHLAQDQLDPRQRRRAEAVLWDVMTPLSVTTLSAPLPIDDRARHLAEALIADPGDNRSLDEWGHAVGASARTLSRLFTKETGMGFDQWRRITRLSAALPMLASGMPVAGVARRVGYDTQSAFVAAFRREIGTTPARYFGSPR